MIPTPTGYYLESYIPSWLAHDRGYNAAFKQRIESMMKMQDFNVKRVDEPFILPTPDCEPAPGMVTLRVEAVVTEFDCEVPMDEDEETLELERSLPLDAQQAPTERAQWQPFEDGEGEYATCDHCGQDCLLAISPRPDQRVICDDCMGIKS